MPAVTPTPPSRADIAAYILAGGASARMGQSKARLAIGGRVAVLHLAEALAPHVRDVHLVAKTDQGLEDLGLPLLYDATPERALVHGLRAALQARGPAWRFVCACDMPAVGAAILVRLLDAAIRARASGSCLRRPMCDSPEPVPSLWHADLASRVSPQWGLTARAWVRAAGLVTIVATPAEAAMLVNLNTPDDWQGYVAQTERRTTECNDDARRA